MSRPPSHLETFFRFRKSRTALDVVWESLEAADVIPWEQVRASLLKKL